MPPVDTDWDHVWEARSVPGAIILSSVASGAQCQSAVGVHRLLSPLQCLGWLVSAKS